MKNRKFTAKNASLTCVSLNKENYQQVLRINIPTDLSKQASPELIKNGVKCLYIKHELYLN